MRLSLAVLAVAAIGASSATAQVQVIVGPNGKKTISNFGGGFAGGKSNDLRWWAKQRNRSSPYDAIIDRHALAYGVDPVLVRAVIVVESNFDSRCVSNKGARGIMQLMPETAKRYGVKDVFDVEQNIRGGISYLADLLEMFPDDLSRALAAYNAGEGAVLRHGGIPPFEETATYVKRALTVYYGRPYGVDAGSRPAIRLAKSQSPHLKGGFKTASAQPLADMPGMRYLGSQ
ncbi:MAG TPA: lytic transglycosylase domain-containing protein [Thermoanaerobaculia bacterium]